MTSYGAYNENLPCKNSSCKSYGRPHPNCKCYGDMAAGGEVKNFCQEMRAHHKDCEYFEDGGSVDNQQPISDDDAPDSWEGSADDTQSAPSQPDPSQPVAEEDAPDSWQAPTPYNTPAQQAGTAIEGVAQGFAGPLATAAELGLSDLGVPNMTEKDIAGRAEANPWIHGAGETAGIAGSLYSGVGEAGLLAKAGVAASKALQLEQATSSVAKVGSFALKGAIQSGLFQGGDNLSKALLGQGNPSDTVGSVLTNGVGKTFLLGGVLGSVSAGLNATQLGTKFSSFLAGIGQTANGINKADSLVREASPSAWDMGAKFWKNNIAALGVGSGVAAYYDIKAGIANNDIMGGLKNAARDVGVIAGAGWGIGKAAPYVGAALLKGSTNWQGDPRSLFQLMNFGKAASNGNDVMEKGLDTLFEGSGQQIYKTVQDNKDLDDWVQGGGVTQEIQNSLNNQNMEVVQEYAEGGSVTKPPVENGIFQDSAITTNYPTENILLNAAKGRIYQYLNGLRPQKNQPKLAFDDEPDQEEKQKSYDRALTIANQPLSVLQEVQKGTIEPEHVKHFNSLYPELNYLMQKKLTERISKDQLEDKKPSFVIRQGLSMLMQTPLSSEFTAQNIQAAQNASQTPGQNQQAPQQASKPKKSTSTLTKTPNAFLTSNQALTSRSQKQS